MTLIRGLISTSLLYEWSIIQSHLRTRNNKRGGGTPEIQDVCVFLKDSSLLMKLNVLWAWYIRRWWIRSWEGGDEEERDGQICTKDNENVWMEVSKEAASRVKIKERKRKRVETMQRERCKGRKRGRERPLVSSFLLVIGFSDWSKLFFPILLLPLSLSPPRRER